MTEGIAEAVYISGSYPYSYVYVDDDTVLSKEFTDNNNDHDYIRFHLVPGEGVEIAILDEDDLFLAVKFGASDPNIYVWDDPMPA